MSSDPRGASHPEGLRMRQHDSHVGAPMRAWGGPPGAAGSPSRCLVQSKLMVAAQLASPVRLRHMACVTPYHGGAELRELLGGLRRTRMMGRHAPMLRREAERDGHLEVVQRGHLPVEPGERSV